MFCDFLTIWVDELSTDERAHIKRLRDAVNQLQRGFDGMKRTVNRNTQCSDVAARNAPSITDVTKVVPLAEIPALKILQNAENNDYRISSTDLQFLNSYFIAKHCLGNAQRVSMLNNMQLSEFYTAIETTKVLRDMTDGHGKVLTDDEGNVKQETNYVICVAEHKTKESYIDNLTISEDQVADQNYRGLNTDKTVDAYQYMARMRVFNAAYPTKKNLTANPLTEISPSKRVRLTPKRSISPTRPTPTSQSLTSSVSSEDVLLIQLQTSTSTQVSPSSVKAQKKSWHPIQKGPPIAQITGH
ncbi:unnamed protein product [Mytilus edulis]|uniref:Uncharacterized protein n=1 Tax=Mytilus edulis TaxID=6550 RepID=A0A8S3UN79_MYTED|nr:unnamed protein product [Mytilus edulis]